MMSTLIPPSSNLRVSPIPVEQQELEQEERHIRQSKGVERIEYPNGSIYIGALLEGKRHGRGKLEIPQSNEEYDGEWQEGVRQGFGVYRYHDGTTYDGEWVRGEKHGFGRVRYMHGDTYDGLWKMGKPSGFGIYTFSTEDRYVGEFADGMQNGMGALYGADKSLYCGDWVAGERHGTGIFISGSGSENYTVFEGEYQHNFKVSGITTTKEGVRVAQEFENDVVVRTVTLENDTGVIMEAVKMLQQEALVMIRHVKANRKLEALKPLGSPSTTTVTTSPQASPQHSHKDVSSPSTAASTPYGSLASKPASFNGKPASFADQLVHSLGPAVREISSPSAKPKSLTVFSSTIPPVYKYALSIVRATEWHLTAIEERRERVYTTVAMYNLQLKTESRIQDLATSRADAYDLVSRLHKALNDLLRADGVIDTAPQAIPAIARVGSLRGLPSSPSGSMDSPMLQRTGSVKSTTTKSPKSPQSTQHLFEPLVVDVNDTETLRTPPATEVKSPIAVPAAEFVSQLERFDLEALRVTIAKAVQSRQDITFRMTHLASQVEEKETRVRLLEADKAELTQQLAHLRGELSGLHEHVNSPTMKEATAKMSDMMTEREKLLSEIDSFRVETIKLTGSVEALKEDVRRKEGALKQEQDKNMASQEEMKNMQNEVEKMNSTLIATKAELEGSQQQMKQRVEDHQQQLHTLQEEQARMVRHKDDEMRHMKEQFESKFITQQLALDSAIRRGSDLELKVKEMVEDHRRQDLELQIRHKDDELASLTKRITTLERDIGLVRSEHEKQVARMKMGHIAEVSDARLESQAEIDRLRKEVDEEQSRGAKLAAQIEEQHRIHRSILTSEKQRADSIALEREEAMRLREVAQHEAMNAQAAQAESMRLLQLERDLRALLDQEIATLRNQGEVPKTPTTPNLSRTMSSSLPGSPKPEDLGPSEVKEFAKKRSANVRTVTAIYRNLATMQMDVVSSFCSELMTVTVHSAQCATDFLAGRYIGKQGLREYVEERRHVVAVRESGTAQRFADDRAVIVIRRLVLLSNSQEDEADEQLVIEVDVWKFDALGVVQDLEIVMCRSRTE